MTKLELLNTIKEKHMLVRLFLRTRNEHPTIVGGEIQEVDENQLFISKALFVDIGSALSDCVVFLEDIIGIQGLKVVKGLSKDLIHFPDYGSVMNYWDFKQATEIR